MAKKAKVWEEGVDAAKIPLRVYHKEMRRHKHSSSPISGVNFN